MSIFARPDSPPPRMPSPDIIPTSLPSPPLRSRNSSTPSRRPRSCLRSQNGSIPSRLVASPVYDRALLSTRSCDHLNQKAKPRRLALSGEGFTPRAKSERGIFEVSPPTTPRSLPLPSPYTKRGHRRTLSFAVPYRSPPPSPTIASPPPPVPPIPSLMLTPTDKKPVLRSQPSRIVPIHLPELENISPISDAHPKSPRKQCKSSPAHRENRGMGMTCLKFFSLRNSNQRGHQTTAA